MEPKGTGVAKWLGVARQWSQSRATIGSYLPLTKALEDSLCPVEASATVRRQSLPPRGTFYEKTGLQCAEIEWQFEHKTRYNSHKVFLAIPSGQVHLDRSALGSHIWWDGMRSIRFRESAIDILRRVGWLNWEDIGPMNGHRTWRQLGPPQRITGYDHEVISQSSETT